MTATDEALGRIDAGIGDAGVAPGAARLRRAEAVDLVQDRIELHIPRGGRAAVVSDLHLTGTVTPASRGCTEEIIRMLSTWTEPGAFVINGDGFEQLHEPVAPIEDIFDAHAEWADALLGFASRPDHDVVVLSGNHDGNIAWDPQVAEAVQRRLGAQHIAISADLVFDTGEGERWVHVVHGNQDDQYNAFTDPRSPFDTPTGHHIVRQVLPHVEGAAKEGGLLDGLYGLSEPMTIGEMLGSRLLYRGLAKKAWLLFLPFVAALLLRLVAFLPRIDELELWSSAENLLFSLGTMIVLVALLVIGVAFATLLGVHHALASTELGQRTGVGSHNAATREHAARVVELGYAGMVAGHTHAPELSAVGDGFYANSGCGVEVLGPRPTRFGLPRPFTAVRRITRVELVGDEVLAVALVVGDEPTPVSWIERLVIKPDRDTPTEPTLVATLPGGATWPVDSTELSTFVRMRLARRSAAILLVVVAVINVVTQVFGPSLNNLSLFADHIPDEIPVGTRTIGTLIAVALLLMARGVRFGYRQMWLAAIVLLLTNAVVLVSREIFFEEAIVNAAAAVWLLVEGRHFRMLLSGRRRWAMWVMTMAMGATGLATAVAIWADEVVGQFVGRVGLGLVLLLGLALVVLVRRPSHFSIRVGEERIAAERDANELIERFGGDTFDHSSIRADKALLFTSGGLVSYAVIDGRMVVSPDPICNVDDRPDLWASTMDFADTHGWSITVLAASATWLPIYHAAGLFDVYLGDEAIIDCTRFVAELPLSDGLEHALASASDRGYVVTVVDVAAIDADDRARLGELIVDAEIGAPGRGFATSIGRVAVATDEGARLAIARSGSGEIVAFDQFLPAPAAGGYVLDLACTSHLGPDAEVVGPMLLVEALRHVYAHGARTMSLGLAASGGLGHGDARGGRLPMERQVFAQLADRTELERRRRVDGEYDPVWRPRYLVSDTMRRAARRRHAPGPPTPAPAAAT